MLMNILTHRGIRGTINFSKSDGRYHGVLLDYPEELPFVADTLEELKTEFIETVEEEIFTGFYL